MAIEFFIFELLVFLFSVVIHEVSHGIVAERLGDPTARMLGRLTLNPIRHIDPFGSIILPLVMAIPALFGARPIIFGWAKPVPYDPRNLKNPKTDSGRIALAGPMSNLTVALIFGIILRFAPVNPIVGALFALIVYINILLAVFNLIPVPPLDGSKILFAILPSSERTYRAMAILEQYGFILLVILLFTGMLDFIHPAIGYLFQLFTGQGFGL